MQEEFEKVYLDLQRECLIEGTRIVSMGAWVYDYDKGQPHWSEGVYDVYGLEPGTEAPLLEECLSYFVEEDRERVRAALLRIQRDGGSYDFECELITKAGVHKFVRVIGKSGSLLDGCKNCLFGVIQDISETRRIRDALVEARDQANAANQAKSNFLATVSHELRTPLNPILGFSDLLLEEIEDEEQLEMVRAINDAGQSLIETINRIIEFAELNPEKLKLRQDRFALSDLVDEVVFELSESKPSFAVEVDVEHHSSLPGELLVVGDFKKVKCVLLHLLENSAKFSGANSAKLRSSLRPLDSEHVIWHVDVEDDGVGIDAKSLGHVFDPFLLGNATFTRSQGGAGMGLAICRGYVELMDGQITVESELGHGATFSFYVCLSTAEVIEDVLFAGGTKTGAIACDVDDCVDSGDEADTDDHVTAGELESSESKDREQVSVLMVEDNAANLFYQTRILEGMGCRLTTATDGQQALDKYRPDLYDVVLLDLHMPGIDGIEVLKSIRQYEASTGATRVPVLVLTADLLTSTQAVCRAEGADAFVSKPVNANDLKHKIADVLMARGSEVEF
jgi:signal transduction histidine kinase/CheY-like chemotaxis protein